jgi:FAD/FMN-containing dehydrogenase
MRGASPADWRALQEAIAGEVALPGSPEYEAARPPAMGRFADVRPTAVIRCREAADVVAALALARRFGLEVAVRGGGHCFAGCSSTIGLLIDLELIDAVSVSAGAVTVGAGARLGDLYDALDRQGRTIAAGCGPSVGIAGLALGGGLGILGRRHGLTSDQLLAAEVVLADGRVVSCDKRHFADLFWALRGAGGCRFGVVTQLTLETVPAPMTTCFEVRWPESAATAILDAWQHWAPEADDGIAASLLFTAGSDPQPPVVVRVFGAATGSEADARAELDRLVARAGVDPASASFEQLPYRQAKHRLAEHDAGSQLKPEAGHLFAKSEFFRSPLTPEAIAAIIDHLIADRVPGEARELDFTPWGGAYNRIPAEATAFVHRHERFLLKHEVVTEPEGATAGRRWLAHSWALAHRPEAGGAYPNFADADLGPWDRSYHGANLERLLRVRALYDPGELFSSNDHRRIGAASESTG